MPTRFDNLKQLALQGMSVRDLLAHQPDFSKGEYSMVQRLGESNPDAIERARLARARANAEFAQRLDRLQRAHRAVCGAHDIASLRFALKRFENGDSSDLSNHIRVMIRLIDRPEQPPPGKQNVRLFIDEEKEEKMSGKSCVGCKFLYTVGTGDSNWTHLDGDVNCAKDRNPNLPADEPDDWDEKNDNWPMTKNARCELYSPGV